MKKSLYVLFGGLLLVAAMPLCAQSGCGDSPENPTAILALVGSAGAAVALLRARLNR